jgi:hypothetical protein
VEAKYVLPGSKQYGIDLILLKPKTWNLAEIEFKDGYMYVTISRQKEAIELIRFKLDQV